MSGAYVGQFPAGYVLTAEQLPDGIVTFAKITNLIQLGTPIATTSGTAHDFTVPAGTRRVSINFAGVSLTGTDNALVQIGPTAGVETTGYVSTFGSASNTTGFLVAIGSAARIFSGRMVLELLNSSTNLWTSTVLGKLDAGLTSLGGGDKAIAGALINVRVTRVGTDTFDAGSVNITYEK